MAINEKTKAGKTFLLECKSALSFLTGIINDDDVQIDYRILAADAAKVCEVVLSNRSIAFGGQMRRKLRAKVVGIALEGVLPAQDNISYVNKHIVAKIRTPEKKLPDTMMSKAFARAS